MVISAERRAQGKAATAEARAVLKRGDLLLVTRCAGLLHTYRFTGKWDGDWLVCSPRLRDHLWSLWHFREFAMPIDDVHVNHILRVNGRLRRFAPPPEDCPW